MWFETGVIQCHSIKRFKFFDVQKSMGNFEWFAPMPLKRTANVVHSAELSRCALKDGVLNLP